MTMQSKSATIDRRQEPCRRKQGSKASGGMPHLGDFQVQQLILHVERDVPSDASLLDGAVAEITASIDRTACWDDVENIGLAVREALNDAMVHGNHCDPEKTVGVSVAVTKTAIYSSSSRIQAQGST